MVGSTEHFAAMGFERLSNCYLHPVTELHTLLGLGKSEGGMDASNMLKPALARGTLRCCGATTIDEYRKYIEKVGVMRMANFTFPVVRPADVKITRTRLLHDDSKALWYKNPVQRCATHIAHVFILMLPALLI